MEEVKEGYETRLLEQRQIAQSSQMRVQKLETDLSLKSNAVE